MLDDRTRTAYPSIRIVPALLALALAVGCASSPDGKTAQKDATTNDETSETARLLERYAQGLGTDDDDGPTAKTGELQANVSPVAEAEGEILIDDESRGADESTDTMTKRRPRPAPGLDEQIDAMSEELAMLLARRAARDDEGVGFGDLARLATLDATSPGLFNTHYLNATPASALTETQRTTLTEWRDFVNGAIEEMEASLDEEQLALYRQIRERESEWRQWDELSIPVASLCTAVYGYGNYNAMNADADGRYRLIAGRRYRSVVYVEVDGFTHGQTVREGVEGYESRVALSMSLYQHQDKDDGDDAGDLLTWKTSEESVEDFSRNMRRDFFLVQTVELPETLSTGRYTLKIRLRDLLSDRQTERRLPIDVVSVAGGRLEITDRR